MLCSKSVGLQQACCVVTGPLHVRGKPQVMTRFYCGTAEVTRLRPSVISGRRACGWPRVTEGQGSHSAPLQAAIALALSPPISFPLLSQVPSGWAFLAGPSFSHSFLPASSGGHVTWAKLSTTQCQPHWSLKPKTDFLCASWNISDTRRGLEKSVINTHIPTRLRECNTTDAVQVPAYASLIIPPPSAGKTLS